MKIKAIVGIILGAALVATVGWWRWSRPAPPSLQFGADATGSRRQPFSYDDYAAALKTYVNDQGLVNYEGLKAHPGRLDAFASAIGQLDPQVYDQWSENEKVAFWINAYNALTLEAIIAHYPIKPSLATTLLYPKSSIRQIPGVWDELRFNLMGREMTLDDIEHKTLRAKFNEPRVHMALVCAAMSCPPLRNEPYDGSRLDAQLDDQAVRFLSNPEKFRIDRSDGRVLLSPIFKWFGEDFVRAYGVEDKFADHSEAERAVLNFTSQYLSADDRDYLAAGHYGIEYLDYDWSLNQQGDE